MKNTKKKGFTIVELVIVIAVIAILAAVAIPTFSSVITKAKQSNAMQAAKSAYTDYLAETNPSTKLPYAADPSGLKLCIKSGEYYFHVDGGVFDTNARDAHTGDTGFTNMTVNNGKLETVTTGK